MYGIIKSVIESGRYELSDMLKKIDVMWLQAEITDEQKDELVELAQSNANPSNSNAPLQEQMEKAFSEINTLKEVAKNNTDEIKAIKEALEQGGTVVPDPKPEQPTEEFPEWVPYNGIPPVPYQLGSKVSHNGKKWESMVANNIWEPGAFGVDDRIWKEVVEEVTE